MPKKQNAEELWDSKNNKTLKEINFEKIGKKIKKFFQEPNTKKKEK